MQKQLVSIAVACLVAAGCGAHREAPAVESAKISRDFSIAVSRTTSLSLTDAESIVPTRLVIATDCAVPEKEIVLAGDGPFAGKLSLQDCGESANFARLSIHVDGHVGQPLDIIALDTYTPVGYGYDGGLFLHDDAAGAYTIHCACVGVRRRRRGERRSLADHIAAARRTPNPQLIPIAEHLVRDPDRPDPLHVGR